MKKVVLIGDSIKFQYQNYVQTALTDVAQILTPEDSARFSVNTLRFIYEWKENGKWGDYVDVVHYNVGLWDMLYMYGDDKPLTDKDTYVNNVLKIDKQLKRLFPKAKIIFANCTSVKNHLYKEWWFKRRNATVEEYNDAVVTALKENSDTIINDMFSYTKDLPDEYYKDPTHFSDPLGIEYVGKRITLVISDALGIDSSALKDASGTKVKKVDDLTFGK